jgi:hypothetical protein
LWFKLFNNIEISAPQVKGFREKKPALPGFLGGGGWSLGGAVGASQRDKVVT